MAGKKVRRRLGAAERDAELALIDSVLRPVAKPTDKIIDALSNGPRNAEDLADLCWIGLRAVRSAVGILVSERRIKVGVVTRECWGYSKGTKVYYMEKS